jgi:hypothetical protein
VARIEPIAPSTFAAWRETWGGDELFSDDAVRDLRSRIGSHHFVVVVTCTFKGQSLSCVFENIPPSERSAQPANSAIRFSPDGWGWGSEPGIYLRKFDPIISMQGEKPCPFAEALRDAETMAKRGNCPIIYTYDDSAHGHA